MARTLVLLHGFTHTGASWAPVVAELGERYRALAPDLRGHGAASERRPVELDAVLGDLQTVLAAAREQAGAGGEPPILVGYSMGGRIALHAALRFGGRLAGLVLVGASPGLATAGERAERRAADERLAEEIEGMTIAGFAERWARTPVLAGQPPDVLAAVHADRLRSTPAGLAAALRGLGTGTLPSLWERLSELTLPVTLVAGERDEKFRALAERMADVLPRGGTHVVAGAGHAVHLERPAALAALLDQS